MYIFKGVIVPYTIVDFLFVGILVVTFSLCFFFGALGFLNSHVDEIIFYLVKVKRFLLKFKSKNSFAPSK